MFPARGLIGLPAALFGIGLLAGCAGLFGGRPSPWMLPGVEHSPIRGNWVQTLVLEREGRRLEVLAALECDGRAMTLVGLSPMGQRLVRITWEGGEVRTETDPNLPVKIDGEAILRDVVFVHWPEAALAAAFAETPWRATFEGPRRTLAWKDRTWLVVTPEADSAAAAASPADSGAEDLSRALSGAEAPKADLGTVKIDHVAEGYTLRVTTVEKHAP